MKEKQNDSNHQNVFLKKDIPFKYGYAPKKKGYKPGTSNLEPSKPPQGGSGVPPKETSGKRSGKN